MWVSAEVSVVVVAAAVGVLDYFDFDYFPGYYCFATAWINLIVVAVAIVYLIAVAFVEARVY